MFNARQITKFIVSTVVTIGVNKIVGDIIKNNVDKEEYLEPEELELTNEEQQLFTEEDIAKVEKAENRIRKVSNASRRLTNFSIGVAGYATSAFVGKLVGDFVDESIDNTFDMVGKFFTKKV